MVGTKNRFSQQLTRPQACQTEDWKTEIKKEGNLL
jgi:hypothetical protein